MLYTVEGIGWRLVELSTVLEGHGVGPVRVEEELGGWRVKSRVGFKEGCCIDLRVWGRD